MAFGDNGQRKKTGFEKLTLIVVVIMLLVTVGAIFASRWCFEQFLILKRLKERFFRVKNERREKYEYVFGYS